jgi:hypothetical protein
MGPRKMKTVILSIMFAAEAFAANVPTHKADAPIPIIVDQADAPIPIIVDQADAPIPIIMDGN